jgi:ubiquinone/menaquinone biosynthesis C-methylase UbiE
VTGVARTADQSTIDARNAAFWDELCGTVFARSLGIETVDPESLRRFDDAYMAFYPYLRRYLELDRVRGAKVLEIGLGFGTVGELLARAGAVYHGVDIAPGPVGMMQQRLVWGGLGGGDRIVQGSALALPFEDGTFDRVYSIGCLHHTGDTPKGVSEVHRVLAPGGRAVVMLYNRHSVRQFVARARARVTRRTNRDEWLAAGYDANTAGEAAPVVEYFTPSDVKRMFAAFSSVRIDVQNFDDLRRGPIVLPRTRLLGNVARVAGTDLYIVADKAP